MRLLRNRLVHESVDDLAVLAAALQRARELSATHAAIRRYADQHLGPPPIRPS